MNRIYFLLAIATVLILTVLTGCTTAHYDLIIKAGVLIDGTSSEPRQNMAILINEQTIVDIVPLDEKTLPRATTVIDAQNQVVIPGLINASVHAEYWAQDIEVCTSAGVTT